MSVRLSICPSALSSVRPPLVLSVRVNQRVSNWMDFREVWYWGVLWQSFEKLQIYIRSGERFLVIYMKIIKVLLWSATWFGKKSILCNNQCCYIFESNMNFKATQKKPLVVFPLQEWLRERAKMLLYTYPSYLICFGLRICLECFVSVEFRWRCWCSFVCRTTCCRREKRH